MVGPSLKILASEGKASHHQFSLYQCPSECVSLLLLQADAGGEVTYKLIIASNGHTTVFDGNAR